MIETKIILSDMKYTIFIIILLFIYSPMYAQSYHESISEFSLELIKEVNIVEGRDEEYNYNLKIYTRNEFIKEYRLLTYQQNIFDNCIIKNIKMNSHTGEEAIFILLYTEGPYWIFGDLKCVLIKNETVNNKIIRLPILLDFNNDMKLHDTDFNSFIKDIDNDGTKEILDLKLVQLEHSGHATASWVDLIVNIKDGKFVKSNEKCLDFLQPEIEILKKICVESRINCDSDIINETFYKNVLASVVISFILVDKLEEAINFYDSEYVCRDADFLIKQILMYYYKEILNFSNYNDEY